MIFSFVCHKINYRAESTINFTLAILDYVPKSIRVAFNHRDIQIMSEHTKQIWVNIVTRNDEVASNFGLIKCGVSKAEGK